MNAALKEKFITLWNKYFPGAELPITLYYTDGDGGATVAPPAKGRSCLIGELERVRRGESIVYDEQALGCSGGKRYLGFIDKVRPGFEYFLSCGNEEMEGERYIRTPEMVREMVKSHKHPPISGKHIVFKRWDRLTEADQPSVVVFFATPDVLSGLFTLANFDQTEPNGTFTPFGPGCAAIVYHPYMEISSNRPRAIIGMFDPSARPHVPKNVLTFAVPMVRFEKMIGYMEESFLITDTWKRISDRMS